MQVKANVGGEYKIQLTVTETRAIEKARRVVTMLAMADANRADALGELDESLAQVATQYGPTAKVANGK